MGSSLGNGSSGRSRRRSRQAAFSDINVTPMVDVMLVLLVIFMVAAPMMTSGVPVDLPSADAAPVQGNDEPLNISVKSDGSVHLNDTPVEMETLPEKLKAIVGEKMDTRIFVRGDRAVDYGRVMQVMGQINSAGFSKVALITEPAGSGRKIK